MSHLTRVQAELMDMDSLEQSLKDLGYKISKNERMQEHGDTETCDLVGSNPKTGRRIGFKKAGKKITVVMPYGYGNDTTQLNQIKQRYSYNKIIKEVSRTRKYTISQTTTKNGSIKVELNIL